MTPEIIKGITERYIELYESITGEKFEAAEETSGEESILERISANVTECLKNL